MQPKAHHRRSTTATTANRVVPVAHRPKDATHSCGAPGCNKQIQLGHFLCGHHFSRLPDDVRKWVVTAYREFQKKPSTPNQRKLRDVQAAIVEYFRMERAKRE